MSLCINPQCDRAKNQVDQGQNLFCSSCGSKLLIEDTYRVIKRLGAGGFGWTYLMEAAGEQKVLKILHYLDPKAISLFDQEAAVLQRLRHPGIPRVEPGGRFDYLPRGSDQPLRCLVMEYIAGETLEDYLQKGGYRPIAEQAAVRWLRELVEILAQVHGANYFHRDIKPSNIMIRPTGQLVLIDFGTAREETATYLQNLQGKGGTKINSSGYTPYEQAQGKAEYRSDFFALGRTFVFLLTAQSPHLFPESLKKGLEWRHKISYCSQELLDLIDYLMCPDVEDRPLDTKEIFKKLNTLEKSDQSVPIPSSIVKPNAKSISEPETEPTIEVKGSISEPEESRSLLGILGLSWLEKQLKWTASLYFMKLGKYKLVKRDDQGAIEDYNQAIKLNPDYAYAYNNRGISKQNLGDNQGAIEDYNQAIKLNPDYANAYNNRGISKQNLGDNQSAIEDYNQAIKLNPDYAYAYNNRGISKQNLGDNQGAIEDYNQAIKLNPDYADGYYSRGLVYKKLNDNDNAISDFRQTAKLYQKQNNQTYYQKSLDHLKELGASPEIFVGV